MADKVKITTVQKERIIHDLKSYDMLKRGFTEAKYEYFPDYGLVEQILQRNHTTWNEYSRYYDSLGWELTPNEKERF